jgi:hypothetical protein
MSLVALLGITGALAVAPAITTPDAAAQDPAAPAEVPPADEKKERGAGSNGWGGPRVAVRFNPLSLLIGKKSVDLDVWPIRFASLTVGYFAAKSSGSIPPNSYDETPGASWDMALQGYEAGVRFWGWTGHAAAPYLSLTWGEGWGHLDDVNLETSFGAIEIGAAAFARPFFASLGVGLQYTKNNRSPSTPCTGWCFVDPLAIEYGDGVRPRFLLGVGLAL